MEQSLKRYALELVRDAQSLREAETVGTITALPGMRYSFRQHLKAIAASHVSRLVEETDPIANALDGTPDKSGTYQAELTHLTSKALGIIPDSNEEVFSTEALQQFEDAMKDAEVMSVELSV